jgi:flagellar hook assembly protein FlgD
MSVADSDNIYRFEEVDLEIFAITGEKVRTLVTDELKAGVHDVSWDGRNEKGISVASGLYFYRLKTEDFTRSKKMLLLR